LGGSRTRKILAIDWDAKQLRIVHALLSKRGVKIDRLLSVAIPSDVDPASPESMGAFIRNALNQEDIHTRHAIVDIPRDQAILKTLTLPPADPESMAGVVRIQIAKELPFPVDGAVIDFAMEPIEPETSASQEPGRHERKTVDVLVAAVRHELRDQYVATLSAAGLRLDRIGLRPYANKVAVCRLLEHALPERVVFIDVRPSLTEIDVLKRGALAFSRAASVMIPEQVSDGPMLLLTRPAEKDELSGPRLALDSDSGEHPPAGGTREGLGEPPARTSRPASSLEKVINALVLEVTRSIEAYRAGDPGATIDHVVIAGDVGVEERLAEAIQFRVGLSTELYNPASTFGWEPDEGANAAAFSATLGLVLGHAETDVLHFDFLHPKRTGEAAKKRLRKAPVLAAVVLLFLAAGAIGLTQYRKDDRATLARIEAEIARLRGNNADNRRFETLMEELRRFDAQQYVWVDVLYDVFSLLPPNRELVVNQLDLQQDQGRVVLKTKSKERDTPLNLIRKLEEFRRPGRERPRFKATMGPQSERKGETYPFHQDLRIELLNDEPVGRTGGRNR
jgi:type IV pilus assembly protein PilM